MKRRFAKRVLPLTVLYCGLLVFLLTTNPHNLPIGWLLVPFVWAFVTLFMTFRAVLPVLWKTAPWRRINGFAAALAFIPVVLLILDSINELTPRDVLLVSCFTIIAMFYISRLRPTA